MQEQEPAAERETGIWKKIWHFFYVSVLSVIISGIVRALAIYIFVTPNDFAPGGVNGIAVLLQEGTGWNSGIFLIMLNVPLFFVAFFLIGKYGAVISTLSMLLTSGLLIVFDYIPGMEYICYQPEVTLKSCGTSGGTTVLASLVNKKFRNLSVSGMTAVFDAIVVFASFFVYHQGMGFTEKLEPVLLALISLFVTSKVCDVILQGFKAAYRFEIITNHPEEISAEIMQKLHHGVTEVNATGMYSHEGRAMLVCIIRKRQIGEVQRILRKFPDTFASFSPASEVYGKFLK